MKKNIVTTTINKPTRATLAYCEIAKRDNWQFIIVGDTKTPHGSYEELERKFKGYVTYLRPEKQEEMYPELSKTIGWCSIQRRNIGFIFAYRNGVDILATVDDDNIPYEQWGRELFIGKEVEIDNFTSLYCNVFDPISVTTQKEVWHRGFPIEFVPIKNQIEYKGKVHRKVLVQADFWDGDPDIDAICRLSKMPIVKFESFSPFCSDCISPFNSQNTFLAREVIPYYAVLPHVGRMDDVWGGYIMQYYFPNSVIYNKATVYQDRNVQDLITNLENEIIGYRHTKSLIENLENFMEYLPNETKLFWEVYRSCFDSQQ